MTTQTGDKAEDLKRLRLFNEKVRELQSYSFIDKAFHQDAGVTVDFDFEKQTVRAKRAGADNEARAAMCLILRFFLQPRDHIKLHQIAELYGRLPVEDHVRSRISSNLETLDRFLDRETELALNNEPITYRRVLETFLYGDQAHANDDERTDFETWKKAEPAYTFLENCFEDAACKILRYVVWLSAINASVIEAPEAMPPAP